MSVDLCIQTGLPCGFPCHKDCKDKSNVTSSVISGEDGLYNLQTSPSFNSINRHQKQESASNWKRIKVINGSARIRQDCPNEVIKALIKLSRAARKV